ncbi:hypothetical protein D3C72_275520 [compost metagenome]
MTWTHRVITAGGGFWAYATSHAQALAIAGGDASRVAVLAQANTIQPVAGQEK